MVEQVRLCAVWPMENWLGSFLNRIQGWTTVPESYSRALEQGPLHYLLLPKRTENGDLESTGSSLTVCLLMVRAAAVLDLEAIV